MSMDATGTCAQCTHTRVLYEMLDIFKNKKRQIQL